MAKTRSLSIHALEKKSKDDLLLGGGVMPEA